MGQDADDYHTLSLVKTLSIRVADVIPREHAKLWGGVSSGDEMDSEAGR
jgi:hypothetical protein